MSEFAFPAVYNDNGFIKRITAFNVAASEPLFTTDSRNPNFEAILHGLRIGDESVWELFDVGDAIRNRFMQVSDRYAFDGDNILLDGDPVHSSFTDLLQRSLEDGNAENYEALAKFGENLLANPNEHSREQAYDWLACHRFQITQDGLVVGYKGVYAGDEDGVYVSGARSQAAGKPSAFVNGLPVPPLSTVPQKVGDVVTMPRSEVAHDPSEACKRGLHVATRDYASSYGSSVMIVFVNPMDIVSVPTDGSGEKVRACRYTVAEILTEDSVVRDGPVLREHENSYTWAGDVGYRV